MEAESEGGLPTYVVKKEHQEDPDWKGKHPLLSPNVPPPQPAKSVKLNVPGYDGYTLTTPREGDAWSMQVLLGFYLNNGPINIKKPYNKENIHSWFEDTIYFTNFILRLNNSKERHASLFDELNPITASIPFQIIRHDDKLIGHCALSPARGPISGHVTSDKEYAKLSFLLSPDHRHRGVMFTALCTLFTIAAEEFDINMVHAVSHWDNESTTRLLQRLADCNILRWGATTKYEVEDKLITVEHRSKDVELKRGISWLFRIGKSASILDKDTVIDAARKKGQKDKEPSPEFLSLGGMSKNTQPNFDSIARAAAGLPSITPRPTIETDDLTPQHWFHPNNVINDPSFRKFFDPVQKTNPEPIVLEEKLRPKKEG
ncbi:uncharacterized protein LY89DRAFT_729603 [Mollisia scopiformis]|uniref:N-acetyltransferase domain-containing protein n=1 Tax=Mollisia scopiformis TaxID=149040 RepID=A0A194XPQ0_MOLSC|nr:uncharacterized protein LY89DRAFT_729603 [Mollisia scopiformis]KUJ22136.1 hypothetical protein LY89DRAFT_729603 [Mollisia scopiformis]